MPRPFHSRCAIPRVRGLLLALLLGLAGCGGDGRDPADGSDTGGGAGATGPDGGAVADKRVHRVLEAEAATVTGAYEVVAEDGTGGGEIVRVPLLPKDFEGDPGGLSFPLELAAEQRVKIWVRAYWGGTCANSCKLRLPPGSSPPFLVLGEDAVYKRWHWVAAKQPVTLPAGEHRLEIEHREDHLALDQVLITSDLKYVPMGIEQQ